MGEGRGGESGRPPRTQLKAHMWRRLGRAFSMLCAGVIGASLLACSGLGPPPFRRIGEPLPLQAGATQNDCEAQDWLHLVEGTYFTGATDVYGSDYWRNLQTTTRGWAVVQSDSAGPRRLDMLLPVMNEPELERLHMSRIVPGLKAQRLASTLFWSGAIGGIVLSSVGLVTTSQPEANEGLSSALLIGSLGSLLVMSIGWVMTPDAETRTYVQTRQHLFVAGEDDLASARRGVDHLNIDIRRRCSDQR
jgi:hypothetical protein